MSSTAFLQIGSLSISRIMSQLWIRPSLNCMLFSPFRRISGGWGLSRSRGAFLSILFALPFFSQPAKDCEALVQKIMAHSQLDIISTVCWRRESFTREQKGIKYVLNTSDLTTQTRWGWSGPCRTSHPSVWILRQNKTKREIDFTRTTWFFFFFCTVVSFLCEIL